MKELFLIPIAQAGAIASAPSVASILLNVLKFLLSIIGIIGILTLVFSGILYFTAAGNEERLGKAKRATLYAIVGIIIAFGSWIIVNTVMMLLQ